jgi:hypothetical protein
MRKLAHIINPFKAPEASDLFMAQPITFESMRRAKELASKSLEVELWSTTFPEDETLVPNYFQQTKPLERSVLDLQPFQQAIPLPLIHDILERLYTASDAEYLIYTNVDIGLYPSFYLRVNELLEEGHDALIINRRRLRADLLETCELEEIYQQKGKKHPGFDCFVFHRDLFPKMQLAQICIGVPFIGITFAQNLFALANNFKLIDQEVLSFHLGMEVFRKRAPREYFYYNRMQFRKVIGSELAPKLDARKFPYAQLPLLLRLIRWGIHPSIPIKLALQLEWKAIRQS